MLSVPLLMIPTVGLAIDFGGFTADARVALDGDLVNVFIDASHACDCMMIYVCYGFPPNISVYLSQVYTRLSPLSYFRPSVTCVKVTTGEAARVAPISTAKAEWRLDLYDTEACWLVLIQLSASLVNIMTRQALEGKASSDLAVSLFN
jgi:hypothetical protein